MSTGILTTPRADRRLRRRVVEYPGEGVGEKSAHAGHEPDDAKDEPDHRQGTSAHPATTRRDSLSRYEPHDRGGRAEDDAQAQERTDDRDDPDDQGRDGEPIRALGRVAGVPAGHVTGGRRWHVASPSRRRTVSTARWRGWDVAPTWWRRGWIESSARRRGRRRGRASA